MLALPLALGFLLGFLLFLLQRNLFFLPPVAQTYQILLALPLGR